MLRDYLLLIRAPNFFTVPSNIIAGYFAVIPLSAANGGQILSLILSSLLLYLSGIVLNDYFDIDVDRKERPNRPLASGRISKRNALILATGSIIVGNIFAMIVSWSSLAVSVLLTSVIIAYDSRLKNKLVAGPPAMGSARFLNALLGGSPALGYALITFQGYTLLVFIGFCLFLHTVAISILSRKEIDDTKTIQIRSYQGPIYLSLSIILVVIISVVAVGFLGSFRIWFVLNLVVYSCMVIFTFINLILNLIGLARKVNKSKQKGIRNIRSNKDGENHIDSQKIVSKIQTAVKVMILSIVALDSVFVSGLIGITAGIATLLLVIPPMLLKRRFYIT